MTSHRIASVDQVCGRLSLADSLDPAAFERGSYLRTLGGWRTRAPATS